MRFEQRKIAAPVPAGVGARLVCVSPSGGRVAFVRDDFLESGIWVGSPDNPLSARRIVALSPDRVETLAFSPDGERIAYRVGPLLGGNPTVGWANVTDGGEIRRVTGTGFAWTPGGKAIIVADPARGAIVRHTLEEEGDRAIGELSDDMDPAFPSRIAVSPDGLRLVYTAGRAGEDISEVWLVTRDQEKGAMVTELLTEVPGANVHILPFWSHKGASLGLFCVHEEQEKSAIIVIPQLEGEGEVLYESSLIDPPCAPAWSASGRYIVFFRREGPGNERGLGPTRLVLLDARRETFIGLTELDEIEGAPAFQDERTLVVAGGKAAHLLVFAEPL